MSDPHYQAVLEARFGIHYNVLNERFFRRLKFVFEIVSFLSGTAAVGAVLGNRPDLMMVAGVAIAVLAGANLLLSPGEAAVRFNEIYRRFTDLDRRAKSLKADEIREAISAIRADAPWGIDSLRPYAYNRCLEANGFADGLMRLTRWQRFVSFFA